MVSLVVQNLDLVLLLNVHMVILVHDQQHRKLDLQFDRVVRQM